MTHDYQDILGREIVTTRIFTAPRAVVFEAWTDPDQLRQWWGPRGFSNTFHTCDIAPGGRWNYTMHGPNGHDYPNEAKFVEIVVPERIVIDHLSTPQFRLTALFDELGSHTKLTFRQLFATSSVFNGIKLLATRGNEEGFDRLAALLQEKHSPQSLS